MNYIEDLFYFSNVLLTKTRFKFAFCVEGPGLGVFSALVRFDFIIEHSGS